MTTPQGMLELPSPETMLTYASILEKQQYVVKNGVKFPIATGEIVEAACAALRVCARQAAAPQGREALDIKPSIYGYQYHDCIRFDGGGREVNGSRPTGAVPFYDQATIDRLVALTRPFYGAECPSYPACDGGCGLGCTKEIERRKAIGALTPAVAPDGAEVALLAKALQEVRQELWVDYCLGMGRTDTDPAPFNSKPHIRIIDDALTQAQEPGQEDCEKYPSGCGCALTAARAVCAAPPPPVDSGREDVTLPIEFIRNCGCPSDRRMTVGECTDRGTCGCSLARRPERSGGRE